MGSFLSSPSSVWQHAKDKKVLITGASGGIGRQLSILFAQEGAHVALLARNAERLAEVASECRQAGAASIETFPVDLTDTAAVDAATKKAIEAFQGFDIVILNAGRSQGCYFEEIQDVSQIEYMLKLNIGGVIITLQKLLPAIAKSSQSRIVIVSSIAGILPVAYRTIYSTTKFAISGFSGALRQELNDTYGADAPAVTLAVFPEVNGTSLNTGRMDFGATLPPVQFQQGHSWELEPTSALFLDAIRRGDREWGMPLKYQILRPIVTIFPALLDFLTLRHLKKTHFRPTVEDKKEK